jgi:endonuclease/exonuclease/phosphatase (EEP) superfamily protein YafD
MKRFALALSTLAIIISLSGMALPLITPLFEGRTWRPAWLLDLAAHWQWLYGLGLLAGVLLGGGLVRRRLLFLPLIFTPFVTASPALPDGSNGPALTLVSANVELHATSPTALMQWANAQKADIIVILEVSPAFAANLASVEGYPHRLVRLHPDAFGLAILSKYPIPDWVVQTSPTGAHRIDAMVAFDARVIAVSAWHPHPPFNPGFHQVRNAELRGLVTAIGKAGTPGLIAGDFNTTPWSTSFSGLAKQNWRRASGLAPTWPQWGRGVIGIPIDHVLATSDWQVMRSEVGPNIGSDHYPIVTQLTLTPALPAN